MMSTTSPCHAPSLHASQRLSPSPQWLCKPPRPGHPVPPLPPSPLYVPLQSLHSQDSVASSRAAQHWWVPREPQELQTRSLHGLRRATVPAATKGPRAVGREPRHCAEPSSTLLPSWQPGLSCQDAPCAMPGSASQGTSTPARQRRRRHRVLTGAAGSGATGTHPASSSWSRPRGHRHWSASQELCQSTKSRREPSPSRAASLREEGSTQHRGPGGHPVGTQEGRRGSAGGLRRAREAAGRVPTCRGF